MGNKLKLFSAGELRPAQKEALREAQELPVSNIGRAFGLGKSYETFAPCECLYPNFYRGKGKEDEGDE